MKIFTFFIIVTSMIHFSAFSQQMNYYSKSKKAIKLYQAAEHLYKQYQNVKAEKLIFDALKKDKNFIEAYLLLADIYYERKDHKRAIQAYKKVLSIDSAYYPKTFLFLGDTELKNGYYEDALLHLQSFSRFKIFHDTYGELVQKKIENCEFSIKAVHNPVSFSPINLGNAINTKYNEYSPSLTVDEKTLVYTSLLPKHPGLPYLQENSQEDFFYSIYKDNSWQKGIKLTALNTPGNEGAQSISADGNTMAFTACQRRDGVGRCDIYLSWKTSSGWTEPENAGHPVNSTDWDSQPSLSADGRTIFFVSNRQGGKGGMDIWMSILTINNTWTKPENLGDSINTPGDEMSPFIHPNGKTLYFASDNHIGLGGLDLFYSEYSDSGYWQKPVNLGYPINTYKDEKNLIVSASGKTAYFSADRLNGMGTLDIYKFELDERIQPEPVTYIEGIVYDAETKKPLSARFDLIDIKRDTIVFQSYSDHRTGEFLVCLPTNRSYALNVNKKGYLFYSDHFDLFGNFSIYEPYHLNVPLQPIKIGTKIVLKNVFFDTDKYNLKPESKAELDKTIDFIRSNPNIIVEISGHTDNVATNAYNMTLSHNRAKTVHDYLLERGISGERLTYKGYGEHQPIDVNTTEQGRSKNRRTELKIIGEKNE